VLGYHGVEIHVQDRRQVLRSNWYGRESLQVGMGSPQVELNQERRPAHGTCPSTMFPSFAYLLVGQALQCDFHPCFLAATMCGAYGSPDTMV
jgi:hypothetical protein